MVLRNEVNGALEENNISMVKKMLEEKLPYDTISRVSGLTIDKIKEIESQE